MVVKEFKLSNEGKRNVKACNAIRTAMFGKIVEVLKDEGFDTVVAENGDIAILTAIDSETGSKFYTRLSVSFTNKDLDKKTVRKVKEKEEVELPDLFDAE